MPDANREVATRSRLDVVIVVEHKTVSVASVFPITVLYCNVHAIIVVLRTLGILTVSCYGSHRAIGRRDGDVFVLPKTHAYSIVSERTTSHTSTHIADKSADIP